jgi:hypothetical protein
MKLTYERLNEIIEEEITSFSGGASSPGSELDATFDLIRQHLKEPHGKKLVPHIKTRLDEIVKTLMLAKNAEFSIDQKEGESTEQWANRMKSLPDTHSKAKKEYSDYMKNYVSRQPQQSKQAPVEDRYAGKTKPEKKKI